MTSQALAVARGSVVHILGGLKNIVYEKGELRFTKDGVDVKVRLSHPPRRNELKGLRPGDVSILDCRHAKVAQLVASGLSLDEARFVQQHEEVTVGTQELKQSILAHKERPGAP